MRICGVIKPIEVKPKVQKNDPVWLFICRKKVTTHVYVAPITHTKPFDNERSLLCPDATKKRLGLDNQPSWIVTSELNHFKWLGFDVRRTPDDRNSYGLLPNKLTIQVINTIKENANDKSLSNVNRDE